MEIRIESINRVTNKLTKLDGALVPQIAQLGAWSVVNNKLTLQYG